jgi:hypothetical protein
MVHRGTFLDKFRVHVSICSSLNIKSGDIKRITSLGIVEFGGFLGIGAPKLDAYGDMHQHR